MGFLLWKCDVKTICKNVQESKKRDNISFFIIIKYFYLDLLKIFVSLPSQKIMNGAEVFIPFIIYNF